MANIASIAPFPQASSPPSVNTNTPSENASSFGAIFDQHVASRQTPARQPHSDKSPTAKTAENSREGTVAEALQPNSQETAAIAGGIIETQDSPLASTSEQVTSSEELSTADKTLTAMIAELGGQLIVPTMADTSSQSYLAATANNDKSTTIVLSPVAKATIDTQVSSPASAPNTLAQDTSIQTRTTSENWLIFTAAFSEKRSLTGNFATTTIAAQPSLAKSEPILSAELQQLMASNETGIVTINRQSGTPVTLEDLKSLTPALQLTATTADSTAAQPVKGFGVSETSPLMATFNQLTSLKTPTGETQEKPSTTATEGLRQEFKGQYIAAKIANQDNGNGSQGQQSNQQTSQQETTNTPQTATSQIATPLTSETSLNFSQVSQVVLNQPLQQAAPVATQPVILAPGTPLHEDAILYQVAERFHFQSRNQETQINIKLHPAELGELKIDLSMKDGSIKAHVVAQSGRIQEILERNMPRLRGMLESQGFTIEEILVSAKADNVDNFDLLQDQLSKRDTPDRSGGKNGDTTFTDTFESIITSADTRSTGVNITA